MSSVGSPGLTGPSGSFEPSTSLSSTRSSGFSGLAALSGLSDRELLDRVKALVSKERVTTLEILLHLIEVERRKLHLSLGYPSLFEYCTRHLGYSSSAAGRRIHAARCVRDFPEIYGLLQKNEVNLSSVSLVASILTEANKDDLLGRIRNKSQKEVEGIVADYRPPVSFRDRARPVCVAVSEPPTSEPAAMQTFSSPNSRSGSGNSPNVAGGCVAAGEARGPSGASAETRPLRAPGENAPAAHCDQCAVSDALGPHSTTSGSNAPSGKPAPHIERKLLIQFLASEAFMKKFEKARALLSNKLGKLSYEAVLETALDEFLARRDPDNRRQRRENRKNEANSKIVSRNRVGERGTGIQGAILDERRGASEHSRDSPAKPDRAPGTPTGPAEKSRHIPAATKDAVFKRDKGRCTYVGSTNKRCDATHNLQIDHVVPYARGGTNTVGNLRLLCARHNKLEAERVYGANTIRRFSARE